MITQQNREERISKLLDQAEQMQTQNPEAGIKAAQQALDLARGSKPQEEMLPEKLADSLYVLGILQGEVFEQDTALTDLFEAYSIFSQLGNPSRQSDTLMAISRVYFHCHDVDLALEYAARALRGFETLRNREKEATALYTIGCMYLGSGFLSLSMNHFNKAISIAHEMENEAIEADALEQMARISLQQNEYYAALGHSLKSFEIRQHIGDARAQARILLLMGGIHLRINALEDAEDCITQGAQYAQDANDPALQVEAHLNLAKYYRAVEKPAATLEQLHQALDVAGSEAIDTSADANFLEIHRLLSTVYEEQGNFEKALRHTRLADEINVNRITLDFQSRLKGQQVSHRMETARKEAEIFELRNVELRQEIEERQHIQAELEKSSIYDALTQVFNRRHWLDLAQREIDRSTRYQQPLSIIILDVERLRTINEQHGWEAGTQTLQHLAARCKANLRKPDILARFGEDEFIILLPQTGMKGARLLAERLREDVETHPFDVGEQPLRIQVALGATELEPAEPQPLDTLIDQATHALYQEKTARRDLGS